MKTYGVLEVQLQVSYPRHYVHLSVQLHDPASLTTLPIGLDAIRTESLSGSCGEKKTFLTVSIF
jgi:hypothetical protein